MSVLHIHFTQGWPLARAYSEEIMKRWDQLDIHKLASSDFASTGDWDLALHNDLFFGLQLRKAGKTGEGSGSTSGGSKYKGATTKQKESNTKCDKHGKW